jgi:hypothetical protein
VNSHDEHLDAAGHADGDALTSEIDARLARAFAAHPADDELLDLRTELRASLVARAAELRASGRGPTAAATQALAELGDLDELVSEVYGTSRVAEAPRDTRSASRDPGVAAGPDSSPASAVRAHAELMRRHRVRPRPAYVVRTVVLSILAAAGLVCTVLAGTGVLDWPTAAEITVCIALLAAPVGVIVGDGVHQETTMSFPVPGRRAAPYGAAAFLGMSGLALAGLFAGALVRGSSVHDASAVGLLVAALVLLVTAVASFGYLGATQTNRKKPWARRLLDGYQGTDRFSQDEAAAARFGIYTVVIFIAAIAVFLVLSFTIGFAWSWLALVAGVIVFFITLARMLFPNDRSK